MSNTCFPLDDSDEEQTEIKSSTENRQESKWKVTAPAERKFEPDWLPLSGGTASIWSWQRRFAAGLFKNFCNDGSKKHLSRNTNKLFNKHITYP